MKIILTNDDMATTYGFSDAIHDSYTYGVATNTSIRTNGAAYAYSKKLINKKPTKIGIGLHINLTQGPCYERKLSNNSGNYKYNFAGYCFQLFCRKNNNLLRIISKDIEAQFKIIKKDNLKIDHISGHDHIHMIPPIFRIVCKLCQKYHIRNIRFCREPFYTTGSLFYEIKAYINGNIIKHWLLNEFARVNHKTLNKYNLKTTDCFYGILHTNMISTKSIISSIDDAKRRKFNSIEILSHPAYPNHPKDKKYLDKTIAWYSNLPQRNIEAKVMKDKILRKYLLTNHLLLVSYKEI